MTRPVRPGSSRVLPAVCALALAGAGCGNRIIPLGPSGNPATVAVTVESFIDVLPVGGSRFYSFTVPKDGLVSLTLLSLTIDGEPSSAVVNLGIGTPRATECQLLDSRTIGADSKPQFRDSFPAGVYCARVADTQGLPGDAAFAVNITRPR